MCRSPVKLYLQKTKKVALNYTTEFYLIYAGLYIGRYFDCVDRDAGLSIFWSTEEFNTYDEIIVTSFHFSSNP